MILVVKPQDMRELLSEIAGSIKRDALVVSLAAGVDIASIESALADGMAVVRVMPNTPAQVDEGMAAISAGTHSDQDHLDRVTEILSATGRVVTVPERYQDAVTAISGSGPAYLFFVVEAMIEAGVHLGLPRDIATELVVQTMLGSAKLLRETGEHPTVLRERVTSPGGTTAAAVRQLEDHKVRAAFIGAMEAARDRSRELAAAARETEHGDRGGRRRERPAGLLRGADRVRLRHRPPDGARPGHATPSRWPDQLGVLDRLDHRAAARDRPRPAARPCTPRPTSRRCSDASRTRAYGLGTTDNPVFAGMHEIDGLVAMASVEAARRVWSGEVARASNISGGLHHAMPDRTSGFCVYNDVAVAIRWLLDEGLRTGRLRRRRRPPRRRRTGDLLRRPAGDDHQPARDAGVPVPRHRLPARDRRAGRRGDRGQRRPPVRAPPTPAGCAPSTRWCRRCCAALPAHGAGHPARLRLPPARSAGRPRALSGRPARLVPGRWPLWPTSCARAAGSPPAAEGTPCSTSCRGPGPTCWASSAASRCRRRRWFPRPGGRRSASTPLDDDRRADVELRDVRRRVSPGEPGRPGHPGDPTGGLPRARARPRRSDTSGLNAGVKPSPACRQQMLYICCTNGPVCHYSHTSTERRGRKPARPRTEAGVETMNDESGSKQRCPRGSHARFADRRQLPGGRFFTVAEVAATVRVSKMSVYRLIHSGQLEAVQFGRSFRVTEKALNAYLEALVLQRRLAPQSGDARLAYGAAKRTLKACARPARGRARAARPCRRPGARRRAPRRPGTGSVPARRPQLVRVRAPGPAPAGCAG